MNFSHKRVVNIIYILIVLKLKIMTLKIKVTAGKAEGATLIDAFDAALKEANIHNYNIIHLSSVIPFGSIVEEGKPSPNINQIGHRLYAVLSEMRVDEKGKYACAGLGWVQNEKGEGLFVEMQGSSEEEVKDKIQKSLRSMIDRRPNQNFKYENIKSKITSIKCENKPVCALVCAFYKTEQW